MNKGKLHEQRTAKAMAGKRVGNTGVATCDVTAWDGKLLIECKQRSEIPKWLTDAMAQVQKHVKDEQLGIVILHKKGTWSDNDMVIMRRRDFVEWHGDIK